MTEVTTLTDGLRVLLTQRQAADNTRVHIASMGQKSLYLNVNVLEPYNSMYAVFLNHIKIFETLDFDDAVMVYENPGHESIQAASVNLDQKKFGH